MNDFDDDLRNALRADAANAPEPPLDWHPTDVDDRVPAGRRQYPLLLAAAAVAVLGLAVTVLALSRGDDGARITSPIGSSDPGTSGAVTPTAPASAPNTFPAAGTTPENFLIVGADSDACVSPDSAWAGAADPSRSGTRSDTIMILRLDPTTRRAAVLSFPRDLWVDIPGHGNRRINTAYVPGDYSLLAATIYDNFGIAVDHYVQVDFCAFKRIVDAVGGVAVPFATPVVDRQVGLSITAPGCHTFSGDEALAYVRSRHLRWVDSDGVTHEDPTADFGRILRQQDFLRRLLDKATTAGLFDPAVAGALIESLQQDVVTEAGFAIEDMLRVVGTLKDVDPAAIAQYRIDAEPLVVSGNAVLRPVTDTPAMTAVLAAFRGDAPFSETPTSATGDTTATTQPTAEQDPPVGAIAPVPNMDC